MDVPALLGRDIPILLKVLKVLQLAKPISSKSKKPSFEMLDPKDFMLGDSPKQVKAMEDFNEDMSTCGGCAQRYIFLPEDWQQTAPVEEKDLQEFLYNVSFIDDYYLILPKSKLTRHS